MKDSSVRIKGYEKKLILKWLEQNKENLVDCDNFTVSEVVHLFIFHGLNNLVVSKNGMLTDKNGSESDCYI